MATLHHPLAAQAAAAIGHQLLARPEHLGKAMPEGMAELVLGMPVVEMLIPRAVVAALGR